MADVYMQSTTLMEPSSLLSSNDRCTPSERYARSARRSWASCDNGEMQKGESNRSNAKRESSLCSLIVLSPLLLFAFRLVYWVVYGLFTTLESVTDLSLSWLPIYHPLKLVFLLWAFLPQYQGSQLVFDVLVRPVLLRHESTIESGVQTAQQGTNTATQRGPTICLFSACSHRCCLCLCLSPPSCAGYGRSCGTRCAQQEHSAGACRAVRNNQTHSMESGGEPTHPYTVDS